MNSGTREGRERLSAARKVLSICTLQRPIPLTFRLTEMTAELQQHGFDSLLITRQGVTKVGKRKTQVPLSWKTVVFKAVCFSLCP